MDHLDDISESGSFAMDVAKTFALSAASTAGIFGGMILVGFVLETVKKRKSKKETTPVIPEQ